MVSLCRESRFDKNHAVRGWNVIGIEIEDRKRKELLRIAERRTVRIIADDASLVPILNELCAAINELTRGRSLVFVMDRSGDWLVPCAGLTPPAGGGRCDGAVADRLGKGTSHARPTAVSIVPVCNNLI